MTKGIDHLVICCNDLEAAAQHYQALGFTVTPYARHPVGTANRLVQLQGVFIELLTVAAPDDIPSDTPGSFNFAAFNQRFLEAREGFSMLVLDSEDARADQRAFEKAGLDTYAPFDFSRDARLPDGSTARVGFSLAFATHQAMPDAAFFTCQQHAPEHFWKPDYQDHANTAHTVIEVAIAAEHPLELSEFLMGYSGRDDAVASDDALVVETARGRIAVYRPDAYRGRYGYPVPDLSNGPRLAGYTIGVASIEEAKRCCDVAAVDFTSLDDGGLAIAPETMNATAVVFEQVNT